MRPRAKQLTWLALFAAALGAAAGCASSSSPDDPTTGPRDGGEVSSEQATLDGEPLVAVRSLPASALSAERLEAAGTAQTAGGAGIAMARAQSPDVAAWELVSPADDGWRVWRPQIVLDVLTDAGADAALVSAELMQWPDACLGAARPSEVCSAVVTPGYRVILERRGARIEYHTARVSAYRIVPM